MIGTFLTIAWISVAPWLAQHDHAPMSKASGGTTTLSAEQVAQLLAGEGMGLARPAELSHYPGPKHAIELELELQLTKQQRQGMARIRSSMLASAKRLGAKIVDVERSLDGAFQSGQITERQLRDLTATAGRLQGELRATHLAAHLEARRLLTAEQIKKYDVLRGYSK